MSNAEKPNSFHANIDHDANLQAPVIELTYDAENPNNSLRAEIAPTRGSNLLRFKLGDQDLIYCDKEFLAAGGWTGNFVMWPLPSRVRNRQYSFEDQTYDLAGYDGQPQDSSLVHGLVHNSDWLYSEPKVSEDSARVTTWVDIEAGSPEFAYYPFPSRLALTYILSKSGLKVSYSVENKGTKNMPFGFGLHPFFNVIDDDMQVMMPANKAMELDDDLLPTGATRPSGEEALLAVKDSAVDSVYTDIDRTITPAILYPSTNTKLLLETSEDFTHLVLYTEPKDKGYICYENLTGSPDMINLHTKALEQGDTQMVKAAHLIILAPGETHEGFIDYKLSEIKHK